MKLSGRSNFILYSLLIILDVILTSQVVPYEIGLDSFGVHILANSLSEFGNAKWILSPLSFFGLYPLSYASTVPFLMSGLSQVTGLEMETVIILYCTIICILGTFTAYLFANALMPENDLYKLLLTFVFSTSPAVLTYSTLTIATRGLLIIIAPLILYLILNALKSLKFAFLTFVCSIFLYATHHMFYFIIPSFLVFAIIYMLLRLSKKIPLSNKLLENKKLEKLLPFVFIVGFLIMFSVPFFMGKFLETSRYDPIYISYTRYFGVLLPFGLSGLVFLILKSKKNILELFLLLNTIFLTSLIYKTTYMKWFFPVLFSPLVGIGLINLANSSIKKRALLVSFLLVSSIIFSGYYQFLHDYSSHEFDERYIEHSTYLTGHWMENKIETSVISNDELFASRLLAVAETVHQPTRTPINNFIYDFVDVNLSSFEYYSIKSEEFYYSTGEGEDYDSLGQGLWYDFNRMKINPLDFGINYFVENTKSNGYIVWNHKGFPSELLHKAYDESDAIYDVGTVKIWKLSQ